MNTEERKDFLIKQLEDHTSTLRSSKDYSMQRFDALLITISGAGVYISFEIIKYIKTDSILPSEQLNYLTRHFKITGSLYTIAIVINFISQWIAYKGMQHSIDFNKFIILNEGGLKIEPSKAAKSKRKADRYTYLIEPANLVSIGFMFVGLICMSVFIWILL